MNDYTIQVKVWQGHDEYPDDSKLIHNRTLLTSSYTDPVKDKRQWRAGQRLMLELFYKAMTMMI